LVQAIARAALLIATLAPSDSSAQRAPERVLYQLDTSVSYVSFSGRASALTVAGRSETLRGSISIARADSRSVRGDIRFATASLEVAPRYFQREVIDSFDSSPDGEVVFSVDSVLPAPGENAWYMDGRLSIRGVAHPVRFTGTAEHIGARIVAEGSSTIDVRRWGITPKSHVFGLVTPSPRVRLSFSVSFVPETARTAELASPD
jgi:polyisoprenoid-binding protein YceI